MRRFLLKESIDNSEYQILRHSFDFDDLKAEMDQREKNGQANRKHKSWVITDEKDTLIVTCKGMRDWIKDAVNINEKEDGAVFLTKDPYLLRKLKEHRINTVEKGD